MVSKATLWIGALFATFGLVFAGIGLWFFAADLQLAAKGGMTSGTVVALHQHYDSDGDRMYRPEVVFTDKRGTRHRFRSQISSSLPAFSRGEQVQVLYDPAAPGDAAIDSFMQRHFLPAMFTGMGSLFALIGGGLAVNYVRQRRIIAQLKRTGLPISAKFIECYRDTRIKINGRSPYRVVGQATHPATGRLQSFKSALIWLDLTEQLSNQNLDVLIDPARPKRYHVDLSEWVDADQMA